MRRIVNCEDCRKRLSTQGRGRSYIDVFEPCPGLDECLVDRGMPAATHDLRTEAAAAISHRKDSKNEH
jgi:hypothetical protein